MSREFPSIWDYACGIELPPRANLDDYFEVSEEGQFIQIESFEEDYE